MKPVEPPVIGHQRWRKMLFLHWSMPPEIVRPLLPIGLTLDLFEGRAWVSVIPFQMRGVRPRLVPEALSLKLLETNVRTYVRLDGREPGIHFFSLEASSLIAVAGARIGLGLPYFYARMHMRRRGGHIEYETQRVGGAARLTVRYDVGDPIGHATPGSLDHFLIERYTLFTVHAGILLREQVRHVPYPLSSARVLDVNDSLLTAAGLPAPSTGPELVHYSTGVDVDLLAPELVRPQRPRLVLRRMGQSLSLRRSLMAARPRSRGSRPGRPARSPRA